VNWGATELQQSPFGVLMLGHGGPQAPDEVRPYVENVVKGRPVPPERVEAVIEQYQLIGGKSPFNELTLAQAKALENELAKDGLRLPVQLGTLFWKPSVDEAVSRLANQKVRRVVAVIMAPQRTEPSFERYIKNL